MDIRTVWYEQLSPLDCPTGRALNQIMLSIVANDDSTIGSSTYHVTY